LLCTFQPAATPAFVAQHKVRILERVALLHTHVTYHRNDVKFGRVRCRGRVTTSQHLSFLATIAFEIRVMPPHIGHAVGFVARHLLELEALLSFG
jgi:hypothetical protein